MAQPLLPRDRLRERFDLYLSPAERAHIAEKARKACLPVSTFIRSSALGMKVQAPPSEFSVKSWAAMARVAGNLNQLAHAVAAGRVSGIELQQIADVADQVKQLRLEILCSHKERRGEA